MAFATHGRMRRRAASSTIDQRRRVQLVAVSPEKTV